MVKVRYAIIEDAPNIAKLHAAAWIFAYDGIMDAEFLDERTNPSSLDRRINKWEENISSVSDDCFILVAVNEKDEAIGFARGGKVHNIAKGLRTDSELMALYVSPLFHGLGAGTALIKAFAKEVSIKFKAHTFGIGVLKANRSVKFYEKLGGRMLFEATYDYPKGSLPELFFEFKVSDFTD